MTVIRLRRGTTAQWADADPVLAAGEPGFDTTAGTLKVGDGTAAWSELPAIEGGGDGGGGGPAVAVADLAVVASTYDGTASHYTLLSYQPGAAEGGLVPDDWHAGGTVPAAAAAGFIADAGGTLNFLVPADDGRGVYIVTPTTMYEPWVRVDGGVAMLADRSWSGIDGGDGWFETIDPAETIIDALRASAPSPAQWIEAGGIGGQWATATTLPSPDVMRVEVTMRADVQNAVGVDDFMEGYSEAADSDGVPGDGGALDRVEVAAAADPDGTVWWFGEALRTGASGEDSKGDLLSRGTYRLGRGSRLPPGEWFRAMVEWDFPGGTITWRVATLFGWDWTHPDDDSTWRTTRTRTVAAGTLAPSDGLEQWIGRGLGAFAIADVRRYDDDVLVLRPDIAGATPGDTTLTDLVMESAPGVPAEWVSQASNEVVAAPGSRLETELADRLAAIDAAIADDDPVAALTEIRAAIVAAT